MTTPTRPATQRVKTWAAWILLVLAVPIASASGAMFYGLFLSASSGRLGAPSRNFGPTSSALSLAESPAWFIVFLLLYAGVAAAIMVVAVVLVRLALSHLRRPR